MKGFLKGMCSVACVLLFIGIGATVLGFATGGKFVNISLGNTGLSIFSGLENGFHYGVFDSDNNDNSYKHNGNNNNNISSSVSNSNIVNQAPTNDNVFEPTQEIMALDFEIGAANLKVVFGDTFKLESEGKYKYNSRVNGDTWKISISGKNTFFDGIEDVTITIPENAVFTKVDLELGAGNFEVNNIVTNELEIELGAGNFKGSGFVVNNKTDISCGASNLEISGIFNGRNDIECGAGLIVMNLDEKPTDYGYKVELGLGRIKLFEQSFNGIADKQYNRTATSFFELECGVGSIEIS